MNMLNATAAVAAITSQNTPEGAARQFQEIVTRGLAKVIADALDQTVSGAVTATAGSPKISGWEKFVKGLSMDVTWEAASLLVPLTQIECYAPRKDSETTISGIGFQIGVGISGSF